MKGSYCSKSIEKLKVIIGVREKDEDNCVYDLDSDDDVVVHYVPIETQNSLN
jgi:hypothetical protein